MNVLMSQQESEIFYHRNHRHHRDHHHRRPCHHLYEHCNWKNYDEAEIGSLAKGKSELGERNPICLPAQRQRFLKRMSSLCFHPFLVLFNLHVIPRRCSVHK